MSAVEFGLASQTLLVESPSQVPSFEEHYKRAEALVSPSSSPSPPSALRKSAHLPCRGYFFFFSFHVSSDFRPISGLCASQAP